LSCFLCGDVLVTLVITLSSDIEIMSYHRIHRLSSCLFLLN
jgi:hypothetical protein